MWSWCGGIEVSANWTLIVLACCTIVFHLSAPSCAVCNNSCLDGNTTPVDPVNPEQCRDWEVEIDLVTWLTTFKNFTIGLHLGSGPDMQCINQELEELVIPAEDGHWCLHLDAQASSSLRAACKIVLILPHTCQGYQRQAIKRSLQESTARHMSTTYQELPEIEWYLVDNFFTQMISPHLQIILSN